MALAALMTPASAALLVYDFNADANGNVSGAPAGSTASAFAGGGSLVPGSWNTGAITAPVVNTFTFTAAAPGVSLDTLVIVAKKGVNQSLIIPQFAVTYKIDGGSSVILFDNGPSSTFNPATSPSIGAFLGAGSSIEFTVTSTMALGAATFMEFDSITLNGAAVPEPASLAIFGSLGAFGLVRRLRRK
ncbi:MAG: PEP-CTERM sorting domain-containing protein [Pirellula sp.]